MLTGKTLCWDIFRHRLRTTAVSKPWGPHRVSEGLECVTPQEQHKNKRNGQKIAHLIQGPQNYIWKI